MSCLSKQAILLFSLFLVLSFCISGVKAETGVLKQISTEEVVKVNDVVDVIGVFENTGTELVKARLKVEVRFEGRFIEVLESGDISVPAGESASLVARFVPRAFGAYEIEGFAIYGRSTENFAVSQTTRVKKVMLYTVPQDEGIGLGSGNMIVPLAMNSAVALILIGFAFFLRRRK